MAECIRTSCPPPRDGVHRASDPVVHVRADEPRIGACRVGGVRTPWCGWPGGGGHGDAGDAADREALAADAARDLPVVVSSVCRASCSKYSAWMERACRSNPRSKSGLGTGPLAWPAFVQAAPGLPGAPGGSPETTASGRSVRCATGRGRPGFRFDHGLPTSRYALLHRYGCRFSWVAGPSYSPTKPRGRAFYPQRSIASR